MKRITFSLRNLILFVTTAGVLLGYSQARRRTILGVAETLDRFGYVVKTPDSLGDLVWQRSPRVQRNYGAPKFHTLLEHWWQMAPETVIIQFDVHNNENKLTGIQSPSDEMLEVLRLAERLKSLGVKEILVDVAYRDELVAFQEFESQSLALGIAKPDEPIDGETPSPTSGLARRRAKKEGARPEDQDALPRSIVSQLDDAK